MPLVANSNSPVFNRLQAEGEIVLALEKAQRQDIRELHIGLLNIMPDLALQATDQQFFRLIGQSNQIIQFYIHPFTLPELSRADEYNNYIQRFYTTFDKIQQQGLDALIITGATPTNPELSEEPFWSPLMEVIDWSFNHVTSTLFSCLATHATLQGKYGQKRQLLPSKKWGVFSHRAEYRDHPLLNGVNTKFDVPHSRLNEISKAQFKKAGLKVLVKTNDDEVHIAVSKDGFRQIFFQGHPEYDDISLLKEYKREVIHYINEQCSTYPPFPDNYLSIKGQYILDEYQYYLDKAHSLGKKRPEFPENLLKSEIDNTWRDSGKSIINNWLGSVYRITHQQRNIPFSHHIDPDNPLNLNNS